MITPALLQPAPKPGLGADVPVAKIPYIAVPACVPRNPPANFDFKY